MRFFCAGTYPHIGGAVPSLRRIPPGRRPDGPVVLRDDGCRAGGPCCRRRQPRVRPFGGRLRQPPESVCLVPEYRPQEQLRQPVRSLTPAGGHPTSPSPRVCVQYFRAFKIRGFCPRSRPSGSNAATTAAGPFRRLRAPYRADGASSRSRYRLSTPPFRRAHLFCGRLLRIYATACASRLPCPASRRLLARAAAGCPRLVVQTGCQSSGPDVPAVGVLSARPDGAASPASER